MSPAPFGCIWKLGLSIVLLPTISAQENSLDQLVAEGRELESRANFAQAEAIFRTVLRLAQQRPSEPLLTASALDCLAANALDQGSYSDAERLFLRALSITQHVTGTESKATATVLWHLAGMYLGAGRIAAAEPLVEKYQSIILRIDPDSAGATHLGNLGRIYLFKHAVDKALPLFEKAVEILQREDSPDEFDMTRAFLDRAFALALLHRLDDAVSDVDRASALVAKIQPPFPAVQVDLCLTTGIVYAYAHRSSDMQAEFQRAIHVAESSYGLTHPILAMVLRDYSQALRMIGDKKQASVVAKRANRISDANGAAEMLGHAIDFNALRR
jgi:tetratricopeptide (TPR) repeat protein